MTQEIAQERGLDINADEFHIEMDKQRERGKKSWKGSDKEFGNTFEEIARESENTAFTGYDKITTESRIQILHDGENSLDKLSKDSKGLIVIGNTPFYGESGGQVGDIGEIISKSGARFSVNDTKKFSDTIIHIGQVIDGEFKKCDVVTAGIETTNRNFIKANHTATHLLQAALVKTLGDHVKQSGSFVGSERLRFDFSHFNAMSDDEIKEVEDIVNAKIWENIQVETDVMNIDDAMKSGATAVFDEKYEDKVRVITIAEFSKELCGGTHVQNTGQIGIFKILKESSPGAGMRRIEAATLKGILDRYNRYNDIVTSLTDSMKVTEENIILRINELFAQTKSLEKELIKMKKSDLSSGIDSIMEKAKEVNSIKIIGHVFNDIDANELRDLSDSIRSREQNSVVLFGSKYESKALLLFAATNNAVKNGIDCGKIIKGVSSIVGGGGGGRKDMAQAGGKSPDLLDKAIDEAVKTAISMVK